MPPKAETGWHSCGCQIANQMTSEEDALVFVTGSICGNKRRGCIGNSDPLVGVPGSPCDFDAACGRVLDEGAMVSPVPCLQVNGLWYVNGLS